MTTHAPYPADTLWTFRSRQSQHERSIPLCLSWEVAGDPITGEFIPDETSARALWDMWFPRYGKKGPAQIYWFIMGKGTFEGAPFTNNIGTGEDFLTYFSWPVNALTGERLNWVRLPVRDKLWHGDRCDKGGFIQELTGWKPSPFEPLFHAEEIARLTGLA
ncbi:hypothetical protein ACIQGO_41135 [Streptomyces shenzhenensis]|uniref:hypothetical protein n=1 Tax=Streptomyces shenzhenensis TaxID=943815 RepID=UPI003830DAAF